MARGGEPPRWHEQYAVLVLEPEPLQDQVRDIIEEVTEMLVHDFPVRVVNAFPSPLGLGLFQFESTVQRTTLLNASPIQFGHGQIFVQRHDEARNFRVCNYTRHCWIMFLGFPLDYQTRDFVKAVIAPFGRLLQWYDGPNKSRVLAQCLVTAPEQIPRSVVLSQGTILGGNGQSWSFPCYILDGHFPNAFPADEDPVPANGNPHTIHGVPVMNPNVAQHWHHDWVGAAQDVQMDVGINDQHMQDAQDDLVDLQGNGAENWPQWFGAQEEMLDGENVEQHAVPQHPDHPQDTVSFDQFGSTAEYLRADGPDIVLRVEDVMAGNYGSSNSSSSSDSYSSEVQSSPCMAFQLVESMAFKSLKMTTKKPPLFIPVVIPKPQQETHCNHLAIIPYCLSLPAVMIKLWSEAQSSKSVAEADNPMTDNAMQMTLALPSVVSITNPKAFLEDSSCRRSTRQSTSRRGFRHIQLEDHPRKRQCTWAEVRVRAVDADILLQNPPRPDDEQSRTVTQRNAAELGHCLQC